MLLLKRLLVAIATISVIVANLHAFGESPTDKKIKELDQRLNEQSICLNGLMESNNSLAKENNSLKANILKVNDVLKMHENNINSVYDETQRLNKKSYQLIEVQK